MRCRTVFMEMRESEDELAMKKMKMRKKERKRGRGSVNALIPYERNSQKLSYAQLGREKLNK